MIYFKDALKKTGTLAHYNDNGIPLFYSTPVIKDGVHTHTLVENLEHTRLLKRFFEEGDMDLMTQASESQEQWPDRREAYLEQAGFPLKK